LILAEAVPLGEFRWMAWLFVAAETFATFSLPFQSFGSQPEEQRKDKGKLTRVCPVWLCTPLQVQPLFLSPPHLEEQKGKKKSSA
jgi:hypothetical protein